MNIVVSKLTVFFENPFWIGIYEREWDGKYEACKIVFGAEPRDYEVYAFLLENWHKLRFSPAMEASQQKSVHQNPKRMQRMVKKQLEKRGAGTKAQQALKLQQQEGKRRRDVFSREQREAKKEQQFIMKQEKRKEKHKGH